MNADIRDLLAFLLGLFIAAALLLPGAVWATTVIPDVPGYTSTSAGYTPSAGTLKGWQGTYNTAAKSYPVTGKITLMSKAVTVPGKVTLLADAGLLAKNAMRLNPYAIAGTLAAGWLIDQGLQYVEGSGWVKDNATPATYDGNFWYNNIAGSACEFTETTVCDAPTAVKERLIYGNGALDWRQTAACTFTSTTATCPGEYTNDGTNWNPITKTAYRSVRAADVKVPMSDSDWDSLPDPTPVVGGELPTAGYMPQGAPVSAPTYDFVPFNAPTGSPYTKPDGSTWQDGVTVSPTINNITNNYNNVKTVNYSTKVTNADGSPVPVPVPEEKPDEGQDQCEKYPDSVGCSKLGEFEHPIPTKTVSFDFEPEAVNMAGTCPADIQVLGSALSFAPACGAMSTIKPIVVGMAALVASLILFGGMRGAD